MNEADNGDLDIEARHRDVVEVRELGALQRSRCAMVAVRIPAGNQIPAVESDTVPTAVALE